MNGEADVRIQLSTIKSNFVKKKTVIQRQWHYFHFSFLIE